MINVDEGILKELPKMSTPRYNHEFVRYKGDFWAIGGSDGHSSIRVVEAFNPISHTWSTK